MASPAADDTKLLFAAAAAARVAAVAAVKAAATDDTIPINTLDPFRLGASSPGKSAFSDFSSLKSRLGPTSAVVVGGGEEILIKGRGNESISGVGGGSSSKQHNKIRTKMGTGLLN